MKRRVFVRGVGAYTPLGATWPATVAELATGATAIRPITRFDATGFPCRVAAAIDTPFPDEDRRLPYTRFAAREAWEMARLTAEPARLGVFLGAESGRCHWTTALGLARAGRGPNNTFDHERFALPQNDPEQPKPHLRACAKPERQPYGDQRHTGEGIEYGLQRCDHGHQQPAGEPDDGEHDGRRVMRT